MRKSGKEGQINVAGIWHWFRKDEERSLCGDEFDCDQEPYDAEGYESLEFGNHDDDCERCRLAK